MASKTMKSENIQMDLNEIVDSLIRRFDGQDVRLSFQKQLKISDCTIILLVFERYYFRSNGIASLFIQLRQEGDAQIADIIGSGGAAGLANCDYGANADFCNKAAGYLSDYGFQVVDE